MAKKKKTKRQLVPRTRNAETLTESQYWGKIRSALRNAFRYWKPMTIAVEEASRKYEGEDKRQKKEYQCNKCKKWFKRKEVNADHIIPCGSLRSYEDIEPFIKALTPEDPNRFQVLCKPCHQKKSNEERKNKNK